MDGNPRQMAKDILSFIPSNMILAIKTLRDFCRGNPGLADFKDFVEVIRDHVGATSSVDEVRAALAAQREQTKIEAHRVDLLRQILGEVIDRI